MMQDPHRLADDPAGSELARALREAQGNVLSREAMERVRAGLLASGIAPGSDPACSHLPAPQTPGSFLPNPLSWVAKGFTATSLKVGLAALGLALLAGAAWKLSKLSTMGAPPPNPRSWVGAPSFEEAAPAIVPAPPVPSIPASLPVVEAAPPAAASAPPSSASLRTAESARTKASAAPASAPSPREGTLLLQARRLLDTDPAQALALVQAHEKEFPRSQLALEREHIAAEARRRSGR